MYNGFFCFFIMGEGIVHAFYHCSVINYYIQNKWCWITFWKVQLMVVNWRCVQVSYSTLNSYLTHGVPLIPKGGGYPLKWLSLQLRLLFIDQKDMQSTWKSQYIIRIYPFTSFVSQTADNCNIFFCLPCYPVSQS